MRAVVSNDGKYSDHIKNSFKPDTDVHYRSRNKTLELMDLSSNEIVVDFRFSIVVIPEQDSSILC